MMRKPVCGMEAETKRRCRRAALLWLCGLLAAGGLYLWSRLGGGIPCLFRTWTGLRCPACGLTRAAVAWLSGDWSAALTSHLLFLPMLLLIFWIAVWQTLRYLCPERFPQSRREIGVYLAILAVLLLWTVARNLLDL